MNYNKTLLMGRLVRDPELTQTSGGTSLCKFSLATSEWYKTKGGEQREETLFIDCAAWGRTGEVIHQYFTKGSPIFVEGKLKLEQWDDRDGNKRSRISLTVREFHFLQSKRDADGGGQRSGRGRSNPYDNDDMPF